MTEADIDRINAEVDDEILQWFLKIDIRYFELCDWIMFEWTQIYPEGLNHFLIQVMFLFALKP